MPSTKKKRRLIANNQTPRGKKSKKLNGGNPCEIRISDTTRLEGAPIAVRVPPTTAPKDNGMNNLGGGIDALAQTTETAGSINATAEALPINADSVAEEMTTKNIVIVSFRRPDSSMAWERNSDAPLILRAIARE